MIMIDDDTILCAEYNGFIQILKASSISFTLQFKFKSPDTIYDVKQSYCNPKDYFFSTIAGLKIARITK